MNLDGRWYNQLKSAMDLNVQGKSITGTYHTEVGNASGIYELVGQTDIDGDESQAIGFVVMWNNQNGSSDSVTTWSGQARIIDGNEYIVTTWLLTVETENDDEWHSTIVNKDIFSRFPPTEDELQKRLIKGAKDSFPRTAKS